MYTQKFITCKCIVTIETYNECSKFNNNKNICK